MFLLGKMLKAFGIELHEYRPEAATLEAGFQQLSPDSGLTPLGIGISSEATSGIGISSLTVNSERYSQESLVQNAEHRLSDSGRVSSGLGMSSLTGPSKYNEEVGIAEQHPVQVVSPVGSDKHYTFGSSGTDDTATTATSVVSDGQMEAWLLRLLQEKGSGGRGGGSRGGGSRGGGSRGRGGRGGGSRGGGGGNVSPSTTSLAGISVTENSGISRMGSQGDPWSNGVFPRSGHRVREQGDEEQLANMRGGGRHDEFSSNGTTVPDYSSSCNSNANDNNCTPSITSSVLRATIHALGRKEYPIHPYPYPPRSEVFERRKRVIFKMRVVAVFMELHQHVCLKRIWVPHLKRTCGLLDNSSVIPVVASFIGH